MKFYDYLEIQPIGNNSFMLRDEKSAINSVEELQDINRRIVKLGETFNKLVVATCDVHFLDPEDEVYRRIIMAGKGFKDADDQAPLFLRTTEEMLKEFEYLGSTKAEEVVITNPGQDCRYVSRRSHRCARTSVRRSLRIPIRCCVTSATPRRTSMYGEELPSDREGAVGAGAEFHHFQRLCRNVYHCTETGVEVQRGRLSGRLQRFGRIFVRGDHVRYHGGQSAAGHITAVPTAITATLIRRRSRRSPGDSGCDMPDKICPVCGKKLVKDGFDIPFETFLGFKGNKEPDIDLNFSGEYQSKAH